ncbi:MAG: bifunctional homocysteine S-methyltransferase/methylenetetrahydrofolate reductase, partial [Acidobacteriota bacterium]
LADNVIVGDGAMGTYLHERAGLPLDRCFPEQNLSDPALVEAVHGEYLAAGAMALRTNTYGAHRSGLSPFGLEDSLRKINIHGARLARQASERRAWILGAIGPLGRPLEPVGRISFDQASEEFREQAEALAEGGVDAILLETIADLREMKAAVAGVRAATDLPLIAHKTFTEDGVTLIGEFPGEVAQGIADFGADVIGANCTLGPHGYFEIMKRMALVADRPLSIFPTAGLPHREGPRIHYHATPEYIAGYAERFAELGVRLIGGCCGHTPKHIAAIGKALQRWSKAKGSRRRRERAEPVRNSIIESTLREPSELSERSALSRKLGRELVVTCEMDIPRGHEMSTLLQGATFLKANGVDALNITDGSRARLRLHPMVICHQIESQVGIETLMHYACRDRNVLGMQSEILGAATLGLRNILIVSGDPTTIGDYPKATSVFEVDSIGLTRIVSGMNDGRDLAGNAIGRPTSFHISVAVNPMADDMDHEIDRLRRKADAGAHAAFTQPIYELATLERFLQRIADLQLPIAVGVLPLRTARHAEFLHNEVPGIDIPEPMRKRIAAAADRRDDSEAAREAAKRAQAAEGVAIAVEFVEKAREMVAGIYLMPPFSRYEMAAEIMRGANIQRGAEATEPA